jgi:hypothetical protein
MIAGWVLGGEQTKMEISPVDAVRMIPMVRSRITDLGLTDVYDIERSSRIGDETYSPSGQNGAPGAERDEDAQDDEDTYDDSEEDTEAEPTVPPAVNGQIDYVA